MTVLAQRVGGRLLRSGQGAVLLLQENAGVVYLRYGLSAVDGDFFIFPEVLLDDWGHEINTIELYTWIQENGLHFPRAEVFGLDGDGREQQCFLRELDLQARHPCWAFKEKGAPLDTGLLIETILVPDFEAREPRLINRPSWATLPMRQAEVKWLLVHPDQLKDPDVVHWAGR